MNMKFLMDRAKGLVFCFALTLVVGCSKEEPAPLPDLPKVEVPEGLVGLYSGRLPCDNCKARMVRMVLSEDSTVSFVQTFVTDTMKTDSLKGKFSLDSGKVTIDIENGPQMKFLVEKSGSLSMLTGSGTMYVDQDSMKADLIRIYNVPKGKEGGNP